MTLKIPLTVASLLVVGLLAASPALADPAWTVTRVESTATGDVTLQVGVMTRPYQGARDLFGLATLDPEGLHIVPIDWGSTLGSIWHDLDDAWRLGVATSPAPAQRVTVQFADGRKVITVVPDTRHLEFGALFLVDAEGNSYWTDANHDGVPSGDVLHQAEALAGHLAADPAVATSPVAVAPPDDGRIEGELVAVAPGAFELAAPARLGTADGLPLDPETLLEAQHAVLELFADGTATHLPDHGGATGRDGQLALRSADLSAEDWYRADCQPGTVCVDPTLGRFLFSQGNDRTGLEELDSAVTHWGDPTSACLRDDGLAAFTQRESEASVILADVSDPERVVELASFPAGWSYDCAFVDDRLYVASRSGVTVVDVSDPTAPLAGAPLNPSGGSAVQLLELEDGVLLTQKGALHKINGDQIDAPVVVESWTAPPEWEDFWLFAVDEALASVSDGMDLVVYELTQPPLEVARIPLDLPLGGGFGRVLRSGDLLVGHGGSNGLLVMDMVDEQVIQRVHDVDPAACERGDPMDHLYGLTLVDGVFWTSGDDGVMNREDPRRWFDVRYRSYELGEDGLLDETGRYTSNAPYQTPFWLHALDDKRLLVVDGEYGLRTLRLTADSWQHRSGIPSAGLTNDVAIDADGRLYTSEYLAGGLHLFDLDPTGRLVSVGYIHRGMSAWGIGSDRSGSIYVGGRLHGQEWDGTTFNSFSGQPEVDRYRDGVFETTIGARCMYDLDDLGSFLACRGDLWFNGEGPPRHLASHIYSGSRATTLVDGRYLVSGPSCSRLSLWAEGERRPGVMVRDLAIPAAPTIVVLEPDEADTCKYGSTEVAGDHVFFARGDRLDIWDFSDPRAPWRAASLDEQALGQNAQTVEVRGDHLFLHGWNGTEAVYTLDDATAPTLLDRVQTPTFGYRSRVFGDLLVQTSYWGLTAFRVPASSQAPDNVVIRYFPGPEEPAPEEGDPVQDDPAEPPVEEIGCDWSLEDVSCANGGTLLALLPFVLPPLALGRRRRREGR